MNDKLNDEQHNDELQESLSDILSIGNILTHYFVSDIHHICCSISQNQDEFVGIKHYLLEQRGWKLIKVIEILNVRGLLYNRNLAKLLITILPQLIKQLGEDDFSADDGLQARITDQKRCFANVKQRIMFKTNDMLTPTKIKSFGKAKKLLKQRQLANNKNNVDSDSESENYFYDHKVSYKKLLASKNLKSNSELCSKEFCSINSCEILNLNDDHNLMQTIKITPITPLNLSYCIVNILSEFALYEQINLANNSINLDLSASFLITESLIDSLKETYFQLNLIPNLVSLINSYKNLIMIASATLTNYNNGIRYFKTLQLIEKLISIISYLIDINQLSQACDFTWAIINLLICTSQNLPQTKEYTIVIRMIRLFSNFTIDQLIPRMIECESNLMIFNSIEVIIDALQQLIMCLQRAKVLYLHKNHCNKKRHSKCNLTHFLGHHCDLLGLKLTHSTTNKSPICCISSVSNILIQILLSTTSKSIQLLIIKQLNLSATCCCSKSFIMESLLEFIMKNDNLTIKKEIFKLIEHIFEVQSISLFISCPICVPKENKIVPSKNESAVCFDASSTEMTTGFDSAYSTSDGDLNTCNYNNKDSTTIHSSDFQVSFCCYKNLLKVSNDKTLTHEVEKHLWSLINYCDNNSKKLLCQQVILPLFLSKETEHENLEFLLQLIKVLVNDSEVSKLFVNVGGLKQLRKLLTDPICSSISLNVFEILLINEIARLKTNENENNFHDNYPCLSSFFDILHENTNDCINQLKTIFPSTAFQNLDSSFDSISTNIPLYLNEDNFNTNRFIVQVYYNINLWGINLRLTNSSSNYLDHIKNNEPYFITSMFNFFQILIELILHSFNNKEEKDDSKQQSLGIDDHEEWGNCLFNLIRLVLPVCLHFTPFLLPSTDILIERNDIISMIREQMECLKMNDNLRQQSLSSLLNLLIDVSLGVSYLPKNKFLLSKIWKNYFYLNDKSENLTISSDDDFTDNGYEADDEINEKIMASFLKDDNNSSTANTMPFIHYGEICRIVLEFIISYKKNHDTIDLDCIIGIVFKILKLCHENSNNRMVLFENNFLEILISGFKDDLIKTDEELRDFQVILMQLFAEIVSYKITRKDLKTFLSLFKEDSPPIDIYLSCLNDIIQVDPSSIQDWIKFPKETVLINQNNINNITTNKSPFQKSIPSNSDINQQLQEHELSKSESKSNVHIPYVIVEVGGINSFMFLFVRVIEMSNDPKLQSQALEILYKACYSHRQLLDNFINELNGLPLISYVLEKSKCIMTIEMMETFMKFIMINECSPMIISAENIACFVGAWKSWHKSYETEKLFYQVLNLLISESNCHREHNIQMIKKGNVFDTLLKMLQEMFMQTNECQRISKESCEMLLNFIRNIIGIPPDFSYFSEMFDCTLLLHKPNLAYINVSKRSFYYFFPSEINIQTSTIAHPNTTKNIEPEEWVIISENISEEEKNQRDNRYDEDVQDIIVGGFISYFGDVIENIREDLLDNIIGPVIKLEYFIILANNKSYCVRESIFKFLANCLFRCKDKELVKLFIKNRGLNLLSNQFHNYPSSIKLLETCFGLILNSRSIILSDFCLTFEDLQFNDIQMNSLTILFALLPQCVMKTELCHNALVYLNKILKATDVQTLKILFENGIIESLTKILLNWNGQDNDGYEGDSINHDVYNCLRTLTKKFFFSNSQNYQTYLNILQFYSVMERKIILKKTILRICQIIVFETALDEIEYCSHEMLQKSYSKYSLGR